MASAWAKPSSAANSSEDIVYEQRQRVLLIAPAVLRDGTWDWFKNQYSMQFEVLSYQEFG